MKIVGQYQSRYNDLAGEALPCGPIYQSDGLSLHVAKHHPNDKDHLSEIPGIVAAPDYIGHNPKEPDSVELVKRCEGNVMVCIKLDRKENYLYIASVYEITEAKLQNRLHSGRLKKY